MLRSITFKQLLEWEAYAALEPFGEIRADYRSAQISALFANAHRDTKKHPQPWPLEDFLLKFGERTARRFKQTWQEKKGILKMWVEAYNKRKKSERAA